MRIRIISLLQRDRGISSGAFSGYFRWALIGMTAITGIVFLSGNATLQDTIQQIIIFGCLSASYDLFSGYTGYYNLGFGAFAGMGAYAFVFSSNAGLNVFPALILAGIVGAFFAAAMSYPFLRLRGAYFAIASLAFVLLLNLFDVNLGNYTGGVQGVFVRVAQANIKFELLAGSLLFLLVCLSAHFIIGRSRLGLALRSIREEEDVSESYGVNAFRMKQIALVLSGFFGGIAGSILAMYLGFINSDDILGLAVALFPVVAAMSGGSGIFLGPLLGSFLLTGVNLSLPSFLTSIDPSIILSPLAVTGILLLLVGLLFPAGLLRLRFFQNYAYLRPDRILRRPATVPRSPPVTRPSVSNSSTGK